MIEKTSDHGASFVEFVDFSAEAPISRAAFDGERYDYVSPGLDNPDLFSAYPSVEVGDVGELTWPYLRKDAPHLWRRDNRSLRNPYIGVLSLDEASVLFNNARRFARLRGLEIGCHYGWSTGHLVAAGLTLDVIDPGLGYPDQGRDVAGSLARVGGPGAARLWAGFSPSIVPAVRSTRPEPWSFAFIDGYHEGRAPLDDAEAVVDEMAGDALVMFHDLTSPHVAAGLAHFADRGWSVGIYNTMQIMGAAWRGEARPVEHVADRLMPEPDFVHLKRFRVLSI